MKAPNINFLEDDCQFIYFFSDTLYANNKNSLLTSFDELVE